MKTSEDKIKMNKIIQEKEKTHGSLQQKKPKEKRNYFELSDEFFTEKINEVSLNQILIFLVERRNKRYNLFEVS